MRKVLALTLTSLLGACQLAPPHARPALPTAQDYPTSYAGDVALGRRAVEISWRDFFADRQLETFVATALERNRDPAVAVAQTQDARDLYGIQDVAGLLALSAGAAETSRPSPGPATCSHETEPIRDTRNANRAPP